MIREKDVWLACPLGLGLAMVLHALIGTDLSGWVSGRYFSHNEVQWWIFVGYSLGCAFISQFSG